MKKDSVLLGLALGIVAPVIGFFIYFLTQFSSQYTLSGFLNIITHMRLLSPVISLSVITDLLVFFIFIWLRWDRSAKGVLAATFIYAGVITYLKFF